MDYGYIGEIRLFGGNFAPLNWAFCDGSLIYISENEAMYSILGTTYGGDGRTTFALPDLRGRTVIGQHERQLHRFSRERRRREQQPQCRQPAPHRIDTAPPSSRTGSTMNAWPVSLPSW